MRGLYDIVTISLQPIRRIALLVGVAAVIATLAGCATHGEEDFAVVVLELKPDDHLAAQSHPPAIERKWVSTKLWSFEPEEPGAAEPATRTLHVQLTTQEDGRRRAQTYVLEIDRNDIGRPRTIENELTGPVLLTLNRPGAAFAFTGVNLAPEKPRKPVFGGLVRVSFESQFLNAARAAQRGPAVADLLRAALVGLDASSLARFAQLPLKPSLDQIIELAYAGVTPGPIGAMYDAGYRFDVPELIRLAQAGVSADDAVALRAGGLEYGVADLIALHQAHVSPAYALGMKDAGFAQSVVQIVRLQQADVSPRYAAEMHRLIVTDSDRDLIRLHEHGISVESVETFLAADYKLAVTELILLKDHGVLADDALALRQAGYAFSLDDLIKLSRWDVPVQFTLSLMAEGFDPLSSDQIVDLHLRRVTPEMIHGLRQPRTAVAEPPAARPVGAVANEEARR